MQSPYQGLPIICTVQSEYIIIQDAKEGGAFCPNETAAPSEHFFPVPGALAPGAAAAQLSVSEAMQRRPAGRQVILPLPPCPPRPLPKGKD